MADFTGIIDKLEGLQEEIENLKDKLGQLQVKEQLGGSTSPTPVVIAPSIDDVSTEIIDGLVTSEFPDCCAVENALGYYCSGTLIAENVVVTADHCKGVTQVFLRGNNVSKPDEGEVIEVRAEHSHPELDLRVLILAQNASVTPRRIAHTKDVQNVKRAMLAGFGTIDLNGTLGYGIKRKLAEELPITSLGCSDPADPKKYGCLPNRELVAGHRGLRADSCRGDSGGPLFIKAADGQYVLLGATSRGVRDGFTTCGDGGIYVRVDLCVDWIEQVTGIKIGGSSQS